MSYFSISKKPFINRNQDGRVVKAMDLSSNGRMSAWVRTPLLVYLFFYFLNINAKDVICMFIKIDISKMVKFEILFDSSLAGIFG